MESSSKVAEKVFKQKKSDFDIDKLSNDNKLNKLLKSIITEIRLYAEDQIKHIKRRAQIGIALSVEKDINKLLEMIVDEARALSNADAGTLYIVDDDKKNLRFKILQNDTLKTRMGGTSGVKSTFPNVPLYKDGKPNHFNVSSYVAITGETVNIPDVYESEGFDFTGARKYDAATGYRSKSMLVIALKNHENDIIGVLQLLNAQVPETGEVIAFSPEYEDHIASLASQAAIALTNAQLIQDLRNLFYAFIKSIATAIDEKSPYTGGHIKRVVDLTMMLAEKINESDEGAFKDVCFNEDELEELRLAAWMHDVGKITTPENVVDKPTKLTNIFDRISYVENRFELIAKTIENDYLKQKIELLKNGDNNKTKIKFLEENLTNTLKDLQEDSEFIKECNNPGEFISDEKISCIKEIASKTYSINNEKHNYLSEDEINNLCIRKGSLTEKERKIIENHATMTYKMLKQLPFPKKLSKVPEYAGSHHEKLDGSGYPKGLTLKNLPMQSRIMAIADIFEALTANDRPYRKPMNLSQAIKIMGFMKNDNHIDPNIFDLFIKSGLYYDYAKKEMNPEQID
ncbi:MAG: HD domain-containing protein [Proteobacteria bacterium]|nr:HD domain-containing protein [Pseudomonadota bacterium]MBU4101187.1 HD domain-containing protein [Pseudomonadota bacterium]MBU4126262.1 HD domain-containing protein [Pseudomonadota bacterium]